MNFKRVIGSSTSIHLFFGLIFFGLLVSSSISTGFITPSFRSFYSGTFDSTETDDVEYWALLIAVGVYEHVPEMNRPTMLQEVANFEDLLLSTENFDADHIKVIKAEEATVINIFKGFRWLDDQEDENDISLVYLTTHGFPHWWDRPPFDESDGRDEALATYRGFLPIESPFRWEHMSNPFGIILDDQFNHWFNNLESQGVGVIVDSCHSGGFNDYFSFQQEIEPNQFAIDFAKELQGQNRIVVTSVPEEDVSYGSYFSHYLIQGMYGPADTDHDDIVTMEEAFVYAKDRVESQTRMNPQIFDHYPGELPVTYI
ncbi:MAG: caspase family protein [Candidatus Thermoplasmatota archaeon]|nr:caspase family protein [Candidatus Thermoplasmatota archaeon]MBS3802124.1 caspase family protein [Candidatus Thermoplasmatota archaeon]